MSGRPSVPGLVSIAWRRLDSPGHDAAILVGEAGGWRLEGAAAFVESGSACHLRYSVFLDGRWATRSASVEGWLGSAPVRLRAEVDDERRWFLEGRLVPAVSGAFDVDLAFTPATNLLPIRRLSLSIGESAPVVAAWLPFPDLDFRPLDQIYRRSAENAYDYSSQNGTFRTTLTVSDAGFVTDYPELWVEERG